MYYPVVARITLATSLTLLQLTPTHLSHRNKTRPTTFFFFFNDPAPPKIYPLPLHDALPISALPGGVREVPRGCDDRRRVSRVREPGRDAQAVGVRSEDRRQLRPVDDVDGRLLRRRLRLPLTRASRRPGSPWIFAASRCLRRWQSWGASPAPPTRFP